MSFSNGNWRLHPHKKIVIEKVKNLAQILMSQEKLGMKRSVQEKPKRSEKKSYALEVRNYLYNKKDSMKSQAKSDLIKKKKVLPAI